MENTTKSNRIKREVGDIFLDSHNNIQLFLGKTGNRDCIILYKLGAMTGSTSDYVYDYENIAHINMPEVKELYHKLFEVIISKPINPYCISLMRSSSISSLKIMVEHIDKSRILNWLVKQSMIGSLNISAINKEGGFEALGNKADSKFIKKSQLEIGRFYSRPNNPYQVVAYLGQDDYDEDFKWIILRDHINCEFNIKDNTQFFKSIECKETNIKCSYHSLLNISKSRSILKLCKLSQYTITNITLGKTRLTDSEIKEIFRINEDLEKRIKQLNKHSLRSRSNK